MRLFLLIIFSSVLGFPPGAAAVQKTYMGRKLADVMGPAGIAWLERDQRESEERISLLVKALQLNPGMQVADIGAGSGTISRLMAPEVLPGGTVFAVDIQQEMLDRLVKEARARGLTNIQAIRSTDQSVALQPDSIDLALMVDVYHEFSYPFEMLQSLSAALKKGGILALVEYRGEDPKVPIKAEHKMTLAQIRKEFSRKELHLEWTRVDTRLPRQHLVFFTRK